MQLVMACAAPFALPADGCGRALRLSMWGCDKARPSPDEANRVATIEVKGSEAGVRLDRWFRLHFPEVGYAYLQKLLRTGQVRVDSRRVEANARLEAGAQVRVPKIVQEGKTQRRRRSRRRWGSPRPTATASSA